MNRRLALAASVSGATVLVAGAIMVGSLLSVGPEKHRTPELAAAPGATVPSAVTSLDPVVVYQDEYEYVLTGGQDVPAAGAPVVGGSEESGSEIAASGGASSVAPAPTAAVASPPPATAAPLPVTTTTTRPQGVPADWPADKPIPPKPADCRQPQLEDDGVWNCQH